MGPRDFSVAFESPHRFGLLVGIRLPVPDSALAALHPSEAEAARSLEGLRRAAFVGGRLAAGVAGRRLGVRGWTVGIGEDGAPIAPAGFAVSISHKRCLAIALVAEGARPLGVDLEDDVIAAARSADLVLSPDERARVAVLSPEERGHAFLVAFALKEATYKALAPRWVPARGRPLRYDDADVRVLPGIDPLVTMKLEGLEAQPVLEVEVTWREAYVVAAVRGEAQSGRP